MDVAGPGLDVWRPAVAVDGQGRVVVAWSQNEGGNWDIYRRTYDPKGRVWFDTTRLTTDPGADTDVVLAAPRNGPVEMAWQAWRDGQADNYLAPAWLDTASAPYRISKTPANEWSP